MIDLVNAAHQSIIEAAGRDSEKNALAGAGPEVAATEAPMMTWKDI